MFQNSVISFILRIICLLTFVVVISLTNSFITISLLTIAFYLFTRNDNIPLIFWWRIVTIISFLISYFTNNLVFLKLVLGCGLTFYFVINPYGDIINIVKKPKIIFNKYFIRFKNTGIIRKDVINKNLLNAIYVTVHLFILFITIMVG